LGLYITTAKSRTFGYALPLYKNQPIKVYMTPEEADKLEGAVKLKMKYDGQQNLSVNLEYKYNKEKKEMEATFDKLPAVLSTELGVFSFIPDTTVAVKSSATLLTTIVPPTVCAASYCANMSVVPVSKTTTIAKIDVKNAIKQRGVDFINQLVKVYNQDANDEKNEVAQKTADFID
jgi:hypothetical protein